MGPRAVRLRHLAILALLAAVIALPSGLTAHFALAPKILVAPLDFEDPEARVIDAGRLSASRADFSAYLKRITAFDTKYDRVQPSFYLHFSLIRGIALQHPENVHSYIDRLEGVRGRPELFQLATTFWFEKQAEVFGGLLRFHAAAASRGLQRDPKVRKVLDLYVASLKVAFLEELIVLGEMPPSVAGLRTFVDGSPAERRHRIDTGAADDSELTPPEEQRRMKLRWIAFRRDVLAAAEPANRCAEVSSLDLPEETVLVEINQRRFSLADLHQIFGKPETDRRWNAVKRVNCCRLVLFYAMADLADSLGIQPEGLAAEAAVSEFLYLAALGIVDDLAPELLSDEGAPAGLASAQRE